ncbi:MAG: sugar ABC transporter permease [Propionibacteriaceae bacterium]|jgi:multiple sugar transport system permease protein|nr:sugar ABC transporter permease [Propionibacteriaceae bacterium]
MTAAATAITADDVLHGPTDARRRSNKRIGVALLFVLPFTLMFLAFYVAPIIYAIVDSTFAMKSSGLGFGPQQHVFVFLDNYMAALSSPDFQAGLGRLFLFCLIEVPLMVVTAGVLALLLDTGKTLWPRGFRVIYFMPYGVPGVIATLLWGFLYIPSTSPVLQGLSRAGIDLQPLDSGNVLFAIANISLWLYAGYNMIVLTAALNSIPTEIYEAARIDRAGEWAMVWRIKLPLIRPSIVLVTLFTIIGTLQLFVEPLVLSPLTTAINSTFTPNMAAYNAAFAKNNSSVAAAMAVIVAVIAFAMSIGFLKIVNRKGSEAW